MNHSIGFVLRGRFVHGVGAPGELEFVEDGCVVVGEDGAISHVAKTTEAVELLLRHMEQRVLCTVHTGYAYGTSLLCATCRRHSAAWEPTYSTVAPQVITMEGAQFCVPGMIDTHVHAPQYQFTGTATDLPLMQWLQTYTFPAERRCMRGYGLG
jgi:cytosine/adenosine deaminase-related metal-dependent hydrolase